MMKVLICNVPGDLVYQDKEYPKSKEGYAIIKIKRIGICGTDLHAFKGVQPFFVYPRILGHELSGQLMDTGGAKGFIVGESVTIIPYFNCGKCIACAKGKPNCCTTMNVCGVHSDGGMSEYLSVPAYSLVDGNSLSFDELALVEPLAIGAHGIRRAGIKSGEFVLVIGAGPIGLGLMEFARIAGAQVIAMDVNDSRLAFCKEKLYVKHLINAKSDTVLEKLRAMTKGNMPTTIIDATGNKNAMESAFEYMAHGGNFVLVGLQKEQLSFNHPEFHKREGTLMSSRNATREDFEHVISCMQKGWVDPKTYITHRVNFDQVSSEFENWLNPANKVIKAMVEF